MTLVFRCPDAEELTGPVDRGPTLPRPGSGTPPDDLTTAHDGDRCVGRLASNRVDLTVPGDVRLTAMAITGLEVDDSHRNDSVLAGLMQQALSSAHERGQVLATVAPQESARLPEFGFGLSIDACTIEVDPGAARPIHRPAYGRIDVLPTDLAAADVPELYERCARSRTGTISRSAAVWRRRLEHAPTGDAITRSEVAFHRDSTERSDGYAHYDLSTDAAGATIGVIRDLWGETADVERALWEHLLSIDRVAVWRAPRRPADDPVRFAMADVRAYRIERRFDEQWLRLLDVDIALGARTYTPSTCAVTLRVLDPVLSHNTGTWRVDSYGSFRSQGDADFEIGIETLSAAYLGGTTFRELCDSGRIVERRTNAATEADTLFGARPRPFCGTDA